MSDGGTSPSDVRLRRGRGYRPGSLRAAAALRGLSEVRVEGLRPVYHDFAREFYAVEQGGHWRSAHPGGELGLGVEGHGGDPRPLSLIVPFDGVDGDHPRIVADGGWEHVHWPDHLPRLAAWWERWDRPITREAFTHVLDVLGFVDVSDYARDGTENPACSR